MSSEQKGMLTAELWEAGVAMMRQAFVRKNNGQLSAAQREFEDWLYRKADPIPGDVAGPVRIRRTMS